MDKKPPRPGRPRPGRSPRNEFGDPLDTVYAGGTPLLDERTGRAIPRGDHKRKRPPKK
jgi:hypothetical protein